MSTHGDARRTRFVCISDTHNQMTKLPQGDVLIHAGDLTNQGSYAEASLSKTVQWLEKADFEAKLVVAGNHDVTLDKAFYAESGSPQDVDACAALLTTSPTITYLDHGSATIKLHNKTSFTVFGSPYSPRIGRWAFGYPDGSVEAEHLWSSIPLDTDIVITHTPPHTHCDESITKRRALGCEALRRALWRVRPRLAVCGHVHEGRGAERVRWNIQGEAAPYTELGVERWEDPGESGNKASIVDLTSRGGRRPLDNDGSRGLAGDPELSRSGRRETCVVNCAIAATNWPHAGGKRFNKPIVVDLDLPIVDV